MKSVAIVILNYNTRHFLEEFLPSVMSTDYANFKVVVADNASTDDSVQFVKNNYPSCELIIFGKNHGFTGGYNLALQQIDADYYVLLNSDVKVQPGWLTPLVERAESDIAIAAVQPKIMNYNKPGEFEYAGAAGGFIDKYGYPFCKGRIFDSTETDNGQYDTASPIFWATGAAMLVKRNVFHGTGGLDTDFFAHMEEIDLCWRMQNCGYQVWSEPKSRVWHVGGGTLQKENPKKTYLNYRNGLVLLYKNLPENKLFSIILMRLLLDHISAYRALFKGKFGEFAAIAKAHRHFLMNFKTWKQKRNKNGGYTELAHGHVQMSHGGSFDAYYHSGVYRKSIVWQYFIKGKKQYTQL